MLPSQSAAPTSNADLPPWSNCAGRSWRGQPETVYASQVGDSHVSIPLCIGIFALYHSITVTPFFATSICILLGATLVHFLCVSLFGRLSRMVGYLLIAAYGVFLYKGLLG